MSVLARRLLCPPLLSERPFLCSSGSSHTATWARPQGLGLWFSPPGEGTLLVLQEGILLVLLVLLEGVLLVLPSQDQPQGRASCWNCLNPSSPFLPRFLSAATLLPLPPSAAAPLAGSGAAALLAAAGLLLFGPWLPLPGGEAALPPAGGPLLAVAVAVAAAAPGGLAALGAGGGEGWVDGALEGPCTAGRQSGASVGQSRHMC